MGNAWKPEDVDKAGFKDREYRHIDPAAINMADFARDLYGEQVHMVKYVSTMRRRTQSTQRIR